MSFLTPTLLAALLPLLALPVILHLLNKGFPQHFRFPSVELIKATMARRSKVHRWRHWVLMLLRTLMILALLLAFLQPVIKRFGSNPASKAGRHVLIIFDHSVSMEHRGDGPTSRERAVHEASKLIDSLTPDDAVNVLLMDSTPAACFLEFSHDPSEAKRFVGRIKPGLGRADVNLANTSAARLFHEGESRPEIYYISDFQRKNWANANFVTLPAAAKLFFVDVGPTRRDNRAILSAHLAQSQILAGDTVPLEISLGNFANDAFNGRVTVVVDKKFSFDQEVSVAPWSEGKVIVPVSAGGPGLHLCEVRLPPDALEYDDHFFLTLAVQEKEEIPIVTDGPDNQQSGAYYLKTALNPFENESGSLMPRLISSSELSSNRLAGVHKMFFTQVNKLSPESCAAISKFIFQGGGLIYFLNGPADAENLKAIEAAIGPNTMPLRLSQHRVASNVVSGAQQVVRGDFKSRYLKLFQGPARQQLSLLDFYDYYQAGATSAGGVLLVYGDESPAMAALHHGQGTLLFLNFSPGELASNLARQRIFPAWMQDLVKAVTADEPPPSAYNVGETIHGEVWRKEMTGDFLNPHGGSVTTKRELSGERYSVAFTPDQLGFYTLGSPRPLYAYGVNTSPDEADLRPIEKEVLPRDFASDHEAHFVAGAQDYEELAKGHLIFHWFVFTALVLLMLESAFQYFIRKVAT